MLGKWDFHLWTPSEFSLDSLHPQGFAGISDK